MSNKQPLADQIRFLGGSALIYGLGTVLLKGLNFLLLPLYTRYLTPESYGVLAVCLAVTTLLAAVFPLSLHGSLARFHNQLQDAESRRSGLWTLWLGITVPSTVMAIALDQAGPAVCLRLIPEIPFDPLIRLAL